MSEETGRLDRIESVLEGLLNVGQSAKPEDHYGKEEFECANCGARVPVGTKFCMHCGSELKW